MSQWEQDDWESLINRGPEYAQKTRGNVLHKGDAETTPVHPNSCFPFGPNECSCNSESEETMLQRGGSNGGGRGASANSAAGGLPWLKPEHLSTEARTMALLKVRQERDRWRNDSIVIQLRYDGRLFLWQVNDKNPNFDLLIDILGEDETHWAGQEVVIFLEQDPITMRYWPRVGPLPTLEKKKK